MKKIITYLLTLTSMLLINSVYAVTQSFTVTYENDSKNYDIIYHNDWSDGQPMVANWQHFGDWVGSGKLLKGQQAKITFSGIDDGDNHPGPSNKYVIFNVLGAPYSFDMVKTALHLSAAATSRLAQFEWGIKMDDFSTQEIVKFKGALSEGVSTHNLNIRFYDEPTKYGIGRLLVTVSDGEQVVLQDKPVLNPNYNPNSIGAASTLKRMPSGLAKPPALPISQSSRLPW